MSITKLEEMIAAMGAAAAEPPSTKCDGKPRYDRVLDVPYEHLARFFRAADDALHHKCMFYGLDIIKLALELDTSLSVNIWKIEPFLPNPCRPQIGAKEFAGEYLHMIRIDDPIFDEIMDIATTPYRADSGRNAHLWSALKHHLPTIVDADSRQSVGLTSAGIMIVNEPREDPKP